MRASILNTAGNQSSLTGGEVGREGNDGRQAKGGRVGFPLLERKAGQAHHLTASSHSQDMGRQP